MSSESTKSPGSAAIRPESIDGYRDRFKRLRSMIESRSSIADIMKLLIAVE